MLIRCPICGERHVSEFTYEGDATVARPALNETDPAPWQAYIYDRANPRGRHREYWHHTGGCRSWLVVERDTLTHDILSVELAGPWAGRANKAGG